ncbi:hypothetical protein SAMN04488061_0809 [Filomicrobium insigne]|uniref:Uncharacterized protein n=1 Tax=Filomicrobium insigne TaxID=418854 RepID=A0A1H0ICM2_9HYPH|nr:hypothetical protein [Filomicrobium insigne]SDO29115.1 hypothetical protein SAMN04488061_0809 [Filomicrobium insigne]
MRVTEADLPEIPVIEVGADFPWETLIRQEERAHALLDVATRRAPDRVLQVLDSISRRWIARREADDLAEVDRIAVRLGRPGAYFLSVNYEWGCTVRVCPSPDNASARLIRVLDWRTPGLGAHIIAAKVEAAAGPFLTLTWPGYTGVLQAVAKGRFAAALNQAPMRRPVGLYPVDWAANRARVWLMPHPTPAHVLRDVFETAEDFTEAKRMLVERPIASPGIFALSGLGPREVAIIERTETEARVHTGDQIAANHWQAAGWHGTARGTDSAGRACQMARIPADLKPDFGWLAAPMLNDRTRLVMQADATEGRLIAQGYEAQAAATMPLQLSL